MAELERSRFLRSSAKESALDIRLKKADEVSDTSVRKVPVEQ